MIKNILVCPLDWGLGHATRCVPVIKELLSLGFNVIIGADKNPLSFLQQEFPELKTVVIPGYKVTYNEQGSSFKLFCESIRFYNFIKTEHQFVDDIITENSIDIIISDNRYGLWSKKIKSIIITHQLFVKAPLASQVAHKKIGQLIANFDECWVPDTEGTPNLSGDLSHLKTFKFPHRFIGPLSRFSLLQEDRNNITTDEYDVLAILSGPEPQRTVFEKMIIEQLEQNNLKGVVVRGLPNCAPRTAEGSNNDNIKEYNHLSTKEFLTYFQKCKVVVCRAGYSSIMDLSALAKRAILVPTPGQTEQEYLAKYHFEQGNFYSQKQNEFDLLKGIEAVAHSSEKSKINHKLSLQFIERN